MNLTDQQIAQVIAERCSPPDDGAALHDWVMTFARDLLARAAPSAPAQAATEQQAREAFVRRSFDVGIPQAVAELTAATPPQEPQAPAQGADDIAAKLYAAEGQISRLTRELASARECISAWVNYGCKIADALGIGVVSPGLHVREIERLRAAPAPSVEAQIALLMDASPEELDERIAALGLDPKDIEARGMRAVKGALSHIRAATAPSVEAPAQQADVVTVDAVAWEGFIADYERYAKGDPKMPFSELRASLSVVIHSAAPAPSALAQAERDSRAMFVARLEKWEGPMTADGVLALLDDCDMLAGRAARAEQSEDGRDAARSQWLGVRERFASVCVDFDSTGTYSRHRVVWHDDKEGWRSVEGQSFAEAIDAAIAAKEQS